MRRSSSSLGESSRQRSRVGCSRCRLRHSARLRALAQQHEADRAARPRAPRAVAASGRSAGSAHMPSMYRMTCWATSCRRSRCNAAGCRRCGRAATRRSARRSGRRRRESARAPGSPPATIPRARCARTGRARSTSPGASAGRAGVALGDDEQDRSAPRGFASATSRPRLASSASSTLSTSTTMASRG